MPQSVLVQWDKMYVRIKRIKSAFVPSALVRFEQGFQKKFYFCKNLFSDAFAFIYNNTSGRQKRKYILIFLKFFL